MNPAVFHAPEQDLTSGSFWDELSQVPATIGSRLPTLDRSLDAYFDRHFAAIIEEWDLVTGSDLKNLENRLDRVGSEITRLYEGKMALESRAQDLDRVISSLERSK